MKKTRDYSPNPNTALTNRIEYMIDQAMLAERAAEKPRNYLGGSRLGVECTRALYYEYHHTPQDSINPKLHRHARLGHLIENENADFITAAGFTLHRYDAEGKQFEFITGQGKIKGHCDGVITGGPIDLPYPMLWESKKMNPRKWKKFKEHGLKDTDYQYWVQLHTYMAYFDLKWALMQAYNADTTEIFFELVAYDSLTAQLATNKGVEVVTAASAEEIPRITRDPSDSKCKGGNGFFTCPYYNTCWNNKKG